MRAIRQLAVGHRVLASGFLTPGTGWGWLGLSGLVLSGVALLVSGCTDPAELPARIAGRYEQRQPAVEGLEQIYTLELRPDWSCAMSREYVKKGKVTQTGTWTNRGRIVVVTLQPRQKRQPAEVFEFKWRGAKLVCTQWDEAVYGTEGLGTFLRQDGEAGSAAKASSNPANTEGSSP